MKKIIFILLMSVVEVSYARGIQCEKPEGRLANDFCKVSYQTLGRLQEMQINSQVSSEVDISAMESQLRGGHIQSAEIKPNWFKLNKVEKAGNAFKLMLEKSQQNGISSKDLDLRNHVLQPSLQAGSSTGTRGGGFGDEEYLLPTGFWID